MLEIHTMRDGGTCLVAQMSDDHLRHMIRLVLRQVVAAEIRLLYPYLLYPYLAEAYLRGMNDIREDLIAVLGRSEALPSFKLPGLPAGSKAVATFLHDDEPPFFEEDNNAY